MSISALSSNLVNDLSQQQNPFRQIRQDFKQLASALQSGKLSDAQSAYANIQQVLQASQGSGASGSGSSSGSGSNGPTVLQSDFAALGQALQSGDLSQAQSALSQLQSDGSQTSGQSQPPVQDRPVQDQPVQDQYVPSSQRQSLVQQAQQDFAALQQVLQTQTGSSTATSTSADPISKDLSSLSQALAAGNLGEAQSAFSQLQSDIQTAAQASTTQPQGLSPSTGTAVEGHHHHHHGGGESESASAAATSSSSTTANTSSGVSIYG